MFFPRSIGNLPANKIPRLVLLAGLLTGISFFIYYYAHNLTLAHYDAKAHLLVARRMVDSLEPGYGQMGVNWLPSVHLVYLPFVVFESQYRSGFLPSVISILAFALSGWLTYRITYRITRSVVASVFAAVILLGNPNLEYLQSCPLTEPLYMVLLLLALDSLISWRESDHSRQPWLAAVWVSLGALCRYEGWCVLAGVLLLLVYDSGLNVREFIYNEGGETLWREALRSPAKEAGWLCAQMGDEIWERLRVDPGWAAGYSLALKNKYFSLYRLRK